MALTSRAFADLITFTRASSGTYFDSAGVMQTATTDVPRFNYEYNGSSWVAKGLRIEPAATNLCTQSEFANGVTDAIVRAGLLTGTTFSGLTGSTGLAFGYDGATLTYAYKSISISAATAYMASVFVRMDDGLAPAFGHTTASNVANDFAVSIGSVIIAPNTYTVTNCGGGLYRVIATTTTSGSPGTNQGIVKYATNSTRTFKVTGYHLETGSVSTSYISTAGSTATRAADVAVISGTNFSSWFNQSAGSVVTYANSPGVGTRVIWQIDDGTANNRYTLYTTGTSLKFDVVAGGVTQASLTLGTITANTTFKAAVAFATNDIAGVLNGGTVQTDASATLPTVDRKRLGADTTGNQLTGHIERDVAYPTRLSDANLQSLTV